MNEPARLHQLVKTFARLTIKFRTAALTLMKTQEIDNCLCFEFVPTLHLLEGFYDELLKFDADLPSAFRDLFVQVCFWHDVFVLIRECVRVHALCEII